MSPEALRLALRNLRTGGRVFVFAGRGGDLVIGRERRVRDGGPPGLPERRGLATRREDPDLLPAS